MALQVFLLPPSPNNTKVMVALAYKGIDHQSVVINPQAADGRDAVIEATGQSLTPAILHDGIKLYDSCSILRYLDANFPGPRLYAPDRETHKEIEGWENYHRMVIGPILSRGFTAMFGDSKDAAELASINADANAATEKLEKALEGRTWLVGDSMTAADITVGCFLSVMCFNEAEAAQSPVWEWMHKNLDLGEGRENCRALVHRVLAFLPDFAALAS